MASAFNRIKKLALGTVQFGLPYGVVNRYGQVSPKEVARILEYAGQSGMDTLDTHSAYGESEAILGTNGLDHWKVITKLPRTPPDVTDKAAWVSASIEQSLKRLRQPQVYGLLLHHPMQLLEKKGNALYQALRNLKTQGRVQKIGISVYTPEELEQLTADFNFDIVQLPFNVLDQRFLQAGWLARLEKAGVEIHTRSVFLQGLLVCAPSDRPVQFDRWEPIWQKWQDLLDKTGQSPVRACLSFVLSQPEISRVLVGVDCLSHLKEIVHAAEKGSMLPLEDLGSDDPELINPLYWSKK